VQKVSALTEVIEAVTRAEVADGAIPPRLNKTGRGTQGTTAKACAGFCLRAEDSTPSGMVIATMQPADSGAAGVAIAVPLTAKSRAPVWWGLSTGAGFLATAGTAGYLRSTLGLILAVVEVAIVLISVLILLVVGLVVILGDSNEARDNLYRFLRWARNKPEPPTPPEAAAARGQVTAAVTTRIPAAGHASGLSRGSERTHAVLPVYKEPPPHRLITLHQWAQRIDRAPSTVVMRWQRRPGFPTPIGWFPSEGRGDDAGDILFVETELDAWRMTQVGLQRNKRRSMPPP
jgi:hypothetical protein